MSKVVDWGLGQAAWLVVGAAVAALAAAFIAQYLFDLHPCVLCIYQRIPYGLAIPVGLLALRPEWRPAGLSIAGLLFLAGTGIAGFHVGVEQGWWQGTAACTGGGPTPDSVDALRQMLETTKPARCDEISWSFLGLSMAAWNVFASLALACLCFYAVVSPNRRVER